MADLAFVHRYELGSAPGAPTLLVLHGTGGDENDLIPLANELMPGAAVLSPRGKVLEHGMPRFFRPSGRRGVRLGGSPRPDRGAGGFRPGGPPRTTGSMRNRWSPSASRTAPNIAGSVLLLRPGTLAGAVLVPGDGADRAGDDAHAAGDARAVIEWAHRSAG